MTSRNMRIVFWVLVACIAALAVVLYTGRQRSRDRIERLADDTPIDAPYTNAEPVTLDLANDSTGLIEATSRQIALPTEATARAKALLDHLLAEYVMPGSAHPLTSGSAVEDVFLVPLPVIGYAYDPEAQHASDRTPTSPVPAAPGSVQPQAPGGQLAVINLRSSFVNAHPSGVEVESLTLASIIGTLHANLPQIEQIRFLVDGQPRETLAGHADLLRTYASRDTTEAKSSDAGQ